MAWICVGCSEQHHDSMDNMGFGLCKECQSKAKVKRLAELASKYKKRKRSFF